MDTIITEKINRIYKTLRSSYKENNLGKIIYNEVLFYKPKKIIEFGTLDCYSTIHIGLALKELNNDNLLFSYDLYDQYKYKHGSLIKNRELIKDFELDKFVKLDKLSLESWMSDPDYADMYHLDISNDGKIVDKFLTCLPSKRNQVCLIEGGSLERDNIDWMKKYNKHPINPIIQKWGGAVIETKFPSLSKVIVQ